MTLKQLTYFLAIAHEGSFLKAAQKVYVAQSALSHQMALLEDELAASLFNRTKRGVTLTPAGELLQAHARAVLRQVDDAKTSIASLSSTPAGRVIVGIPHSVSNALALPLFQSIRLRMPKIELELTEELTGNLIRQLHGGQLHMAVLFDDGTLDDLDVEPLVVEHLSVIVPAVDGRQAWVAANRRTLSLQEALALPLILPAAPHGVRPIIERAATQASLSAPNVVADISSISILRTALLAEMGCTLLPVMPLMSDIHSGALRALALKAPGLSRTVCLCRSARNPPSAAAELVWQATMALVKQLSADGRWVDTQVL
jgi:LysR family nitrogen assimilation transcriptional regulator